VPTLTDRTIVGPVSGKDLTEQSTIENPAELMTTPTMHSGQTRCLGSLPAKEPGALLIILLSAHLVTTNSK